MSDLFTLLSELAGTKNKVTTEKLFIQFMGDSHSHGAVLSQLIFWTPKSKNGGWIAKTYADWYEEIVVTERQVRAARKKLESMGLLKVRIKKFNGNPTVHYRIDTKKCAESILTFCKERNQHFVRNETNILSESLTEEYIQKNTTEEREEAPTNFKETTSENQTLLKYSAATIEGRAWGAARAAYENFIKAFGVKDNYKLQTEAMRISIQEWEEIENHLPGYINRTDPNGKDNKPFRATAIGYLKGQTWVNNPNTVKEVATAPILKRF